MRRLLPENGPQHSRRRTKIIKISFLVQHLFSVWCELDNGSFILGINMVKGVWEQNKLTEEKDGPPN